MKILLVEDDAFLLEAIPAYLRQEGHQVEAVCSCQEAVQRARVSPPETVIVDARSLDGPGTLAFDPAIRDVPVYVVDFDDEEVREEGPLPEARPN